MSTFLCNMVHYCTTLDAEIKRKLIPKCDNVALVYKFVYTIGDYLSRGHIDILVRDEVEDPILCVPSANKPIVYTNL